MSIRLARLGVIAALVVLIVAARAHLGRETSQLNRELAEALPDGERAVIPVGYFVNGIATGDESPGSCTVVRVVESGCRYCGQGRDEWNRLMGALGKVGCRPLGLLTRRKNALPPTAFGYGGDEQLAFITMDWVSGFHPHLIPSTIVVGRAGRVLWYRSGMLLPGDASAAAAAVREAER